MTRLQRLLIAMGIILVVPACAEPAAQTSCVEGVLYVSKHRAGLAVAVDREGNPLPCTS